MLFLDNQDREYFFQDIRNSLANLRERLNLIPQQNREEELNTLNELETKLINVDNALRVHIDLADEPEPQSLENIKMMANLVHDLIGTRYQIEKQINDNFISKFEYDVFYSILSHIHEFFDDDDTDNPHIDDFDNIREELTDLDDIATGREEHDKLEFNDALEDIMWDFLAFLDNVEVYGEPAPEQNENQEFTYAQGQDEPDQPDMPAQGGKRTKSRRKRTIKRKKGKKRKTMKGKKGKKLTKRRK